MPESKKSPNVLSGEPAVAPDFSRVYAENREFVWRSLRRLGLPEADLPDACQDAFVIVHKRLRAFAGRSSLRTWLFGICLRLAANWSRKAHLKHEVVTEDPPHASEAPTQGDGLQEAQARVLLDRILDQLDREKRAVFILFELEGWPMQEVADAVECPLQTAYSRLHAARVQIATAIALLQTKGGCA